MRASRSALLRVVASPDVLIFDERAAMPGRGAWVHPTRECLDNAIRRRAFARALRVSASIGFSEAAVSQTIEDHRQRNKG
jgi:predicted RNA-binding protein YlxR (DUF448 family)